MPCRTPRPRRVLAALSAPVLGTLIATATAAANPALTDAERAWIASAEPVLQAGRAAGLAIAVVVQPKTNAGESAVASAWHQGECLLVLTLRGGVDPVGEGRPDAPPPAVLREAVVAHELAHCVRQAGGEWHRWPGGATSHPSTGETSDAAPGTTSDAATGTASVATTVASAVDSVAEAPDAEPRHLARWRAEMAATRREEGYADLAALAWVAAHHRPRYAQVHAWLWSLRADGSPDGSHHDTRAWLTVASGPAVFDADPAAATPWAQAVQPWRAGLQ